MTSRHSMAVRRCELLTEVAEVSAAVAVDHDIALHVADQIGAAVADMLAESWAGQVLSYPKDCAYKLAARDREILAEYRLGTPVSVLVRRHELSDRSVRRLIKRAELRDPAGRQPDLF